MSLLQGGFYVVTRLWPIVHLRDFEAVTGPKLEGWLVKTSGALITVIGGTLLFAGRRHRVGPEAPRRMGGGGGARAAYSGRMIDELVRTLGLAPHPEGGFFRETWRSEVTVETPRGTRSVGTAIYYLLPRGTFAAWHRVSSAELWHFYDGHALTMYLLDERQGRLETVTLGRDVTRGERPQVLVPAGVLQAALPRGDYTLCGCTVAPGFDFADWEMPRGEELAARHPEHAELFHQLSHPGAPKSGG